ncbi:MAG: DUF1540 domain-containing protein, partial [Ruminococcus sp.]
IALSPDIIHSAPMELNSFKEIFKMETKKKNDHIKCTVSQCQHNMVTENYCSLGCISVGTHEENPTVPECTDCNSFVKRTGCCG